MTPPTLATWLLLTLGAGPDVEAIAGDLREQYPERSRAWYWRQVGHAVGLSALLHLRRHAWTALAALLLGGAVMGIASVVLQHTAYWLLPAVLPAPIRPSSLPVLVLTLGLPAVLSGWVLGRLYRPHAAPYAMALATLVLLLQIAPRLAFLIRNSLEHERFLPYLWGFTARIPLVIAFVVIGVLVGTVIAQAPARVRDESRR